jgi:EmrB/QacA subfamily drug resistance transporter
MAQNISKEGAIAKEPVSENKRLMLALSGIILSILLAALDQSIVSPAMPRIVEELQGFSLFAWVTTAYLLTSTATIPIAGKLGDMFGRKTLLLSAVFIFLLGSALSGAAPAMIWLVIFRGLQGVGAGALQANAFAMIAELFPDSAKRARWQGFIAAAFGLSSVIGPTLGGFITDNLMWRWVFYVNLPVGALAILALIFNLPKSNATGKRKIDWFGAASITGAVVALLLALTWGGQKEPQGYAWDSPQIIGLFGAAIVLAALFIYIESKVDEPIVPLHLFKVPAVRSVAFISFSLGAVMLGATLYIPLFVQVVLGQTASSSGAITTPLALALVFANILTGQFTGRVGILKIPFISGAIITSIGVGLLTTLNSSSPSWEVTLFMIVVGVGLGQIMPSMTIAVQESVQRRDLGVGISTVQFFRAIGSTVGVAVVGTIVNNSYVTNINAAPAARNLPAQLLTAIQEPQNLLNKQVAANLPPTIVGAVHDALSTAIHNGFMLALGLSLVTVLVTFTVPNIRVRSDLKKKKIAQTELAEGMVVGEGEVPANIFEQKPETVPAATKEEANA